MRQACNTRRSVTTALTIAIGTSAVLLFGAYTIYTTYGLQTSTVQRSGHLTVYRDGYFNFGAGNPAAWGIDDYATVPLPDGQTMVTFVDVTDTVQVERALVERA